MKSNITLYLKLFLVGLLGFSYSSALGQVFEITKAVAEDGSNKIELYVKAYQADGRDLITSSNTSHMKATMRVENDRGDSLKVLSIDPIILEDGAYKKSENPMSVLFLLDLSGSMRGIKLAKAKQAIKDVLDRDILRGSKIEFAWFHDLIGESQQVSKYNFSARVGVVDVGPKGKGKDTDLYRAIKEKTNELSSFQGQKVIVLLTDGKNDVERNPLYKGTNALPRINQSEILRHVSQFDSTLQIYAVGVGSDANENFLKDLTNSTKNPRDSYSFGVAPGDLSRTFITIASEISQPNFLVTLFPNQDDTRFGSERRTIILNYKEQGSANLEAASITSVFAPATRYIDLRPVKKNYLLSTMIGIILLGLLLAVLSLSVPIYNDRQFRKEYIKKYREVRIPNRQKSDPLTLEPFKDDDLIVVNKKRDLMMKLTSWKYYREHNREDEVGKYAELFKLQTKSGQFFSQRGIFKKLNWLWFGALGGFLAWGIGGLFEQLEWGWYRNLLTGLDNGGVQISSSVFAETITGLAMGLGIVGALASVEETGQSRKFDIGRILLRIGIGFLAAWFIFFLESALIAKLIPFDYLAKLVGWTLFGTALGCVISLFSSIEPINAVKGGLIASLAAFHLYYLFSLPFMQNIFTGEISRVLSFISYGGILGLTLFTVVANLETFELRCLSPKDFRGWQSPISKWLKSPSIEFISIGKNPKSRVYIKWEDDTIRPNHARMRMIAGRPHIEPDEGPVLVNRRPISGATLLKNEDQIWLGEKSISILQFISKEEEGEENNTNGASPRKTGFKATKRSTAQVQATRNKIKITRNVK